jgi:hypothetical protein
LPGVAALPDAALPAAIPLAEAGVP